MRVKILIVYVLLLAGANVVSAQTTEFTYQGRLVDGALPANASYDFEFRLFDVDTGGAALGTQNRSAVAVSNGVFLHRVTAMIIGSAAEIYSNLNRTRCTVGLKHNQRPSRASVRSSRSNSGYT
ncbi:MAG: hypothetical protein H0U23_09535 [Blastocatellia bacterium]|nr:hypothetical protein [Blastocatellia bacterium]